MSVEQSPRVVIQEQETWCEEHEMYGNSTHIVRFIGRSAVGVMNGGSVRKRITALLGEWNIDSERIENVESVFSELNQNAFRHGANGGVEEVLLMARQGNEVGDGSEVVDLCVINGLPEGTVQEGGTISGLNIRNEDGVVKRKDDDLDDADELKRLLKGHGYGMHDIVEELTDGCWGYVVSEEQAKKIEREKGVSEGDPEWKIYSHATFSPLGRAGLMLDQLKKAA